jgi:hypothetical protein
MTWTRLDDHHFTSVEQLSLSRNARLLYVEGLIFANANLTDGYIPATAMRLVTDDPEVLEDARALIAAGLWENAVGGFSIVDFTRLQRSREDVEKVHELGRLRQNRQRQHKLGDHSGCDVRFCHVARADVTRDQSRDSRVSNGVSHDTPTRPDPTRPVRSTGEGGTGTSGSLTLAPTTRPSERPTITIDVQPDDDELPEVVAP